MRMKMITGLSLLLLLVSGCATTSNPTAAPLDVTTLSNVELYMATVNAHARNSGAQVTWVHIPDEGDLARYDRVADAPKQ
jgi:hypothetical protein